jgi:N-acetyl-anhydromuramyl-L-alanine amidase AmpD
MRGLAIVIFLSAACVDPSAPDDETADELAIDRTRMRDLATWRPAIAAYSDRHYGEPTADLAPIAIVVHYTAAASFPWNLVDSTTSSGEAPGLGCHYVVDGATAYQLLPDDVRGRCALGANHRSISIEIVATDEADLLRRPASLDVAARLIAGLRARHGIAADAVHGHAAIDRFDGAIPWVFDRLHAKGSGKIDPGPEALAEILARVDALDPT